MFENLKPKRYKLDTTYQLSLNQLSGEKFNQILFNKLPVHNDGGVGLVTKIEVLQSEVITTTTSDPAIPAYMLARLTDLRAYGGDNFLIVDRLGWHDPVREYTRYGRFVGAMPADIAGGSTVSWNRTMTKQIVFDEPQLGPHRFWRCLPATWWKTGRLELNPHTAVQAVNGAHPALSDITVSVYVEMVDVPFNMVPIAAMVREGFKTLDKDSAPTPGAGQYLRCYAVEDPALATFKDDLASVTTLRFGKEGAGGFPIPENTDVTELIRTWNDKYSQDMKPFPGNGITSEFFRFLDPTSNATGRLHAIPLVHPARGTSAKNAPDWFTNSPEMKINNNNRSGTPATVDFIYDAIVDRDDKQTAIILEGIRPGAWSKWKGAEAHALIRGTGKPQRMPALVNLT